MAPIYIIMGVSGCGKTTIGKRLAQKLNIPFYDADDFHPQVNIDKMASGTPLEDSDRWPWLDVLATQIKEWEYGEGAVIACSALKEVYRAHLFYDADAFTLRQAQDELHESDAFAKAKRNFIYLEASFDLISERIAARKGHFFDPTLLQSQFKTLEVPEYGVRVNIDQSIEVIIKEILQKIQ